MTNQFARLLSVALAGMLLIGCGGGAAASPSPPAEPTLAGTAWRAVSVAGRATVVGSEPKLAFAADQVTGTGGCNQFGGDYTYVDGKLKFGDMPMTLMGCEEPIGSIEGDFLKILTTVTAVSIDDGGQLMIDSPSGQALLVPSTR